MSSSVLKITRQLLTFTRAMRRFLCTLYAKASCESYVGPVTANRFTKLTRRTVLGRNVHFNGMKIQGLGKVSIGDNFHSGEDCLILCSNHKYDDGNAIPYDPDMDVAVDVVICDNVWLGSRVIILPGAHIEEGAIIQAGSVVASRVTYCGIAGGHPARVFRQRNVSHYEELKRQNRVF